MEDFFLNNKTTEEPKKNINEDVKETEKLLEQIQKMKTRIDVANFEKRNNYFVVLTEVGKGWYHANLNSALFMYNMMHELLNFNSKLNCSFDKVTKESKIYTAYNSQRHLPRLRAELPSLGCKVVREDNSFFVFKLGSPVAKEQIREWHRDAEVKDKQIEALYNYGKCDAGMYVLLSAIMEETISLSSKLSVGVKEIGAKLFEQVLDIHHGVLKKDNAAVMKTIMDMSLSLPALYNANLVNEKKIKRMGTILRAIISEVEKWSAKEEVEQVVG
jgi:hypothetical protein